ncbi:MAG: glycoside hydrolase family 3 C-terminal domain-containing protein [Cyclobacteriaceae bacterium]|nr:glycoside hydrolase family 3 C-terminal domain-containing protein [Cyclobacteriaceae bacterium HetDA_MAG_MS6]
MRNNNFNQQIRLFLWMPYAMWAFLLTSCTVSDQHVDEKVESLLSKMTLEEKVNQLSGDGMRTPANDRLNIPGLYASDGPFGAHGQGPVTAFPVGVCLASTWNEALLEDVGAAIGKEAKSMGINLLLGPCVNMARHPLGGRNFESYGEDPYLAGKLGAAYIRGVQEQGVAACVKHYAVNNQEWYRHFYSAEVDDRTLREIYLPAFEMAVKEADVWSVMTAYNKVNGTYAGEHQKLMNEILKDEWGFKGITIPDWTGAHSTVESANAGLDVIVYGSNLYKEPLLNAVGEGQVSESVLDEMTRRTLRVKYLTKSFEEKKPDFEATVIQHQELARQAAREGMVLLENNGILPLNKREIKKIAVIGPNADVLRYGGGGSSHVGEPTHLMSPFEAIKSFAGDEVQVNFAKGVDLVEACHPVASEYLSPSNISMGKQGLWGEYFNNMNLEGKPVFSRLDSIIDFKWGIGPPIFLNDTQKEREDIKDADTRLNEDRFSVRWTGKITPPKSGPYSFVVATDDGIRVYLDGKLIIDNWWSHDVEYQYSIRELQAGRSYKLKIEYYEEIGGARMSFGWQYHDPQKIEEAVQLAKDADAAIVCVGLSKLWEAEAYDRISMDLPSIQDKLISEVLSANKNAIVVLNTSGSITEKPWMTQASAFLQSWYPGQGGSEALAEVLWGDHNPSGKLPVSMIRDLKDFPPAIDGYQDPSLLLKFSEGVMMGYRYHDRTNTDLLYPFGHGLSYSQFLYEDMQVQPAEDGMYNVNLNVTNTGDREGAEIVQIYVSDQESSVPRPVKELKAFQKLWLEAGETKKVSVTLDSRSFAYYDNEIADWRVEPGQFIIHAAASSKDIRLSEKIEIK